MRLTRLVRVGLALTGAALIALGCVGAAFVWSGGALAFIVAGVVLLVGALVGVFPRGSIKEGTIEWPEVDKHPRVDAIEAEVAALQDEIAKARDETSAASGLLLDYILAHLPEPDDDLAAEERVERSTGATSPVKPTTTASMSGSLSGGERPTKRTSSGKNAVSPRVLASGCRSTKAPIRPGSLNPWPDEDQQP